MLRERLNELDSRAGVSIERPALLAGIAVGFLILLACSLWVATHHETLGLSLIIAAPGLLFAVLALSGVVGKRR